MNYFFFNDTATTEIYTLSLHDALPIWRLLASLRTFCSSSVPCGARACSNLGMFSLLSPLFPIGGDCPRAYLRSEEHTSELQSRQYLVCRLLLEKKKYILSLRRYLISYS